MEYPVSLYFETEPAEVQVLDLCRGEGDYRKVYIAGDGGRKLVIKTMSNGFSNRRRILGSFCRKRIAGRETSFCLRGLQKL